MRRQFVEHLKRHGAVMFFHSTTTPKSPRSRRPTPMRRSIGARQSHAGTGSLRDLPAQGDL
jgi:hypothetical protein